MKRIFSNCRGSLGSLLKIASNPFRSSSAFAMLVGCVSSDAKKAGANSVQKTVGQTVVFCDVPNVCIVPDYTPFSSFLSDNKLNLEVAA